MEPPDDAWLLIRVIVLEIAFAQKYLLKQPEAAKNYTDERLIEWSHTCHAQERAHCIYLVA